MSSQFLTFIFMIFVSIQLSSCGWLTLLSGGKKELATEKTTEKSDEPNSSPEDAIEVHDYEYPTPQICVCDCDRGEPTIKTILYPEVSTKFPNSGKEIKSIPTTSSNSTDNVVNYVSSTATQITDNSTPTTEKSEIMKRSYHSSSSKGSSSKIVNYVPSMVHWLVLVQTAVSWAISL